MKIERFEDVESWREARILVTEIYRELSGCRDFGFKDQIQRAAISVMSNIAEGFDRESNRDFIHFLIISRGSASEVKSLAYAGLDIGHFDDGGFRAIAARCTRITSLLNGFIRFLKTHPCVPSAKPAPKNTEAAT